MWWENLHMKMVLLITGNSKKDLLHSAVCMFTLHSTDHAYVPQFRCSCLQVPIFVLQNISCLLSFPCIYLTPSFAKKTKEWKEEVAKLQEEG
jgi:hypothetical protein